MVALDTSPRRSRGQAVLAFLTAGVSPGLAGALLFPAREQLAGTNLAMLLLLSVLGGAAAFGIGPGLLSAFSAALVYNLFFLEPRYTLRIAHSADLVTFAVFFAVALGTGWLAGRARDNERRMAAQAAMTAALLEASRALGRAATPGEAAQALADQLAAAGAGSAAVLVLEGEGLRLAGAPAGMSALAPESLEAARFTLDRGAPPADDRGDWAFAPLEGLRSRVGVVGLLKGPPRPAHAADLAGALIAQGGVVLERALLAAAASENDALREADRLRSGLLNSISHDFRTPLASILGSATTLSEYEGELPPSVRRDLLRSIQQDAQRLNAHIGALLDMARLEGGALRPAKEWTDVREVLGSALRRLKPQLAGRRIERDWAPRLSLVRADPTLLEQAILNLLDNAARFTPPGGAIRIAAQEDARWVLIAVDDEGPGIPPEALPEVFDKFRRLKDVSDSSGGLGLGLSITRGFVEAMGGRVAATSPLTDRGGTRFVISLIKSAQTPGGLL